LGFILVVIFRIQVGDEIQRAVPRAQVQQADLRVARVLVTAALAGAEQLHRHCHRRRGHDALECMDRHEC